MGFLGAIGAALTGGLLGGIGARQQQKASVKMAREQMAFQERMSNTAYQRAAKDLTAAGLNRVLALGSPASSPGGAMGTAQNVLGAGVTAGQTAASTALTAANARNVQLQGDIIAPEAQRARWIKAGQDKAENTAKQLMRDAGKQASTVTTYPYPEGGTFAESKLGRQFSGFMDKLNNITYPQSTDRMPSIETPTDAKEVRQGTKQQHIEAWADDYYAKHKRWPSEQEIRKEWDRVKDLY